MGASQLPFLCIIFAAHYPKPMTIILRIKHAKLTYPATLTIAEHSRDRRILVGKLAIENILSEKLFVTQDFETIIEHLSRYLKGCKLKLAQYNKPFEGELCDALPSALKMYDCIDKIFQFAVDSAAKELV